MLFVMTFVMFFQCSMVSKASFIFPWFHGSQAARGADGLVVGVPRGVAPGPFDAALHAPRSPARQQRLQRPRPIDDLPVADLCELGVLQKEPVQPVEGALARQEHGEEHLRA